jgi:putative peptide zinc metalloprotease protein
LVLGALLLCVLPVDRSVSAPAVLSPIGNAPLVSGDAAQIVRILAKNGDVVSAGQAIVELAIPEIEREAAAKKVEIERLSAQIDRAQSDALDLSNRAVLERQLAAARDGLAGLTARQAKLVLRAPIAGKLVDIGTDMHAGRWLGGSEVVARIVTPGGYDVEAYVSEGDVWRLTAGASARFVPDDASVGSRAARLAEVATSAAARIDLPVLASLNGGPIAVASGAEEKLKPRDTVFHVHLIAAKDDAGSSDAIQPQRGRIVISAAGESLFSRALKWCSAILAREWSVTG